MLMKIMFSLLKSTASISFEPMPSARHAFAILSTGIVHPILLLKHSDQLRLITIGHQVMLGVNVIQWMFVIVSSQVVDVLVFLLHLYGVYGHPIIELLYIGSLVLGEVHIHKASQRVPIRPIAHMPCWS